MNTQCAVCVRVCAHVCACVCVCVCAAKTCICSTHNMVSIHTRSPDGRVVHVQIHVVDPQECVFCVVSHLCSQGPKMFHASPDALAW